MYIRIIEVETHKNITNYYRMDKFIGKTILVNIPNTKRPRWRLIVRKREDGRYIVRTPKLHVLLRDFKYKRDADFGKESLLPLNSTPL